MNQPSVAPQNTFPCGSCGAKVEFAPGTTTLKCPYCGHQQEIAPVASGPVRGVPIEQLSARQRVPVAQIPPAEFVCGQCAGKTSDAAYARKCQFCKSPMVADLRNPGDLFVPNAVLPFALDNALARDAIGKWIQSRWFAPNDLKKVNDAERTQSTYLPYWTYDANTVTEYTGQRGEHYYVTVRDSDGNTQREQRTHWYPAAGTTSHDFRDVPIIASQHAEPKYQPKLEPWPTEQAKAFQPEFIAGHWSPRYQLEPEAGFQAAQQVMAQEIERDCEYDIGGDEQIVQNMNTQYAGVLYKLMLMPIWLCTYVYRGDTKQVLVNGVTGEVHGERPYSWIKITAAVIAALIVVAVIVFLYLQNKHH